MYVAWEQFAMQAEVMMGWLFYLESVFRFCKALNRNSPKLGQVDIFSKPKSVSIAPSLRKSEANKNP